MTQHTPFSTDELTAQRLAGLGSRGAAIRSFLTAQHRSFFESLQYVFVATSRKDGWPIADIWTGHPGFVASPDEHTIKIVVNFRIGSPAPETNEVGARIGLLGIDLTTRRRNRMNGEIINCEGAILTIHVEQSFGNCPRYIHERHLSPTAPSKSKTVKQFSGLPAFAADIIAKADTFFVASASGDSIEYGRGLDVSHRGGPVGFVVLEGNRLIIPDYSGNRYYNTLGNFLGEPRAGLMFVDFSNGSVLKLQGRAKIFWDKATNAPETTERSWHFEVEFGSYVRSALPFYWSRD